MINPAQRKAIFAKDKAMGKVGGSAVPSIAPRLGMPSFSSGPSPLAKAIHIQGAKGMIGR